MKPEKKALLAAKVKAEQMAETLNAKVGDILSINEDFEALESSRSKSPYNTLLNAVAAIPNGLENPENVLTPGTIPILIRVKTTFRIVPP